MEKTWEKFIKELQISVNKKISNLNPHREYILKDNQLRKRIILTEIRRNSYKSPFDMIDQSYTREYYNTNLLIDQLKSIDNIFNTTKSFPEIMERKENLELIKKILSQYIEYLVSNHFELILNELFKLESTENSLNNAILMIKGVKNNLALFKNRYISCSMKIVLKKQKYNNLNKMKNFLEKTLGKWHKDFKEAQKLSQDDEGGYTLFDKYNKIQNDIIKWKNSNIDINQKNNLLLPDLIIQNLKKRMEKIKIYFDDKLNTIFTEKKNNLKNIYNLFCIIKVLSTQDPIEAFKISLKKSMRDSIFNITKDLLSQNMTNVYNINMQNITNTKFSVFRLYTLKEKDFFKIINTLLSKIIIIPDIYFHYLNQEKNNNIGKLLHDSSKEFYLLFEKKFFKIINLISPNLSNSVDIINVNQPFIKYISSLNIFSMTLQYFFKSEESNYIQPYLFDLVKKQFNFQIKYYIKKICVFLGSDVWKRVPYEEKLSSIFLGVNNIYNNNKNINNNSSALFHYKKFMPLFSKESYNFIKNIKKASNDTYESIPELFNKFINEHDSVLSNIKYNENLSMQYSLSSRNLYTNLNLQRNNGNNNTIVVEKENKEQNNQDINNTNINLNNINNNKNLLISAKNILSGSTITTIRFIREFLENIFLYPSLKDYIFKKALIIFEYYFIGSLNILMFNKQYFEQIFKIVDLINMRRPNGLIQTSEFALFLENFIDLKKFLVNALKNFSDVYDGVRVNLFEDSNKLNNANINELLEQNKVIFPKLNPSMPLDTSNKYCLLIETIVLVESVYSVYKYIKKLKKVIYKSNINDNIISNELDATLSLYKKALNQLTYYLYKPVCLNILIIQPILKKISNKNWDVDTRPKLEEINENYIDLLIDEIIEKKDKLDLLSGCSITTKSFLRFFYVLIDFVITLILNKISKIDTWSDDGRNLFYDEMNIFKNTLIEKLKEKNLNANVDIYFDKLFKFIKAWFFNEEKIMNYINENKIEFKYVKSLVENGKEFKNKNIDDKKRFLTKIEEMYYGMIIKLNERLNAIK